MMEFIKNTMDWVLQKEQEAATKCYIKPEEIQKQLDTIKEKRVALQGKYNDDMKELDHIIARLELIKTNSKNCRS